MDVSARLTDMARRCLRSLEGARAGLVVAVSSGPDSVALVRALVEVRPAEVPPALVLAHLNHQLRGPESDADEDFVTELHSTLSAAVPALELCRGRLDVREQAEAQGDNLEAAARRARYRWLAGVARARSLRWVATGHTADDQAETVLFRLLRGTGLQGLRGIAPRRPLEPGVDVVRPLLKATRAEVLAYLHGLGQAYRQDSSNSDLRYTRNRIRHELLPHLAERYNPRVAALLARLAEQADETFRAEEQASADLLVRAELPRAGPLLVLDGVRLAEGPRRLVRGAFRLLWAREGWPLDGLGYEAWERLAGLAFGEGTAADLPGHVHARRRGRVVQVGRTLPGEER